MPVGQPRAARRVFVCGGDSPLRRRRVRRLGTRRDLRRPHIGASERPVARLGPKLIWVRVSDVERDGVDPATGNITKRYSDLPHSEIPGGGVDWIHGALWVVNWSDNSIWRIPTLVKCRGSTPTPTGRPDPRPCTPAHAGQSGS